MRLERFHQKESSIKIKRLKLFQSIKIGTQEIMFLKEGDNYDVELLQGSMILIKDTKGNHTITSLFNSQYIVPEDIKDVDQFRMLPAPVSIKKKVKKHIVKSKE